MFSNVNSAVVQLRSELSSVLYQSFSIEPSETESDSPYNLKIQESSGEVVFSVIPERLNGHNYLTVQSREFPEFKTSRRIDRPMDRLARKIGKDLLIKSLKKAHLSRSVISNHVGVECQREKLSDAITEAYAKNIETKIDSSFTMKAIENSDIQTKIRLNIENDTGKLNIGLELNNLSETELGSILNFIYDQKLNSLMLERKHVEIQSLK